MLTLKHLQSQSGFTLLELIISSVIVVFLGLTGFRALKTAMAIREDVTERHVSLREFELTTAILRHDFNRIQRYPLPKPTAFAETESRRVIDVNPRDNVLLAFYVTANPALRQPMRRVEIVVKNTVEKKDKLLQQSLVRREYAFSLDEQADASETILLPNVKNVRVSAAFPSQKNKAQSNQSSFQQHAMMPDTITLWFTHPRYGELSLKHGFL